MLVGTTFSAFIVMQQPGTYQGVSDRLVMQINVIKEADLWVMSTQSWDFSDPTYFNSTDIYRIRAIPGVLWATKIYRFGFTWYHPNTNKAMAWELMGIDPETLIGLPKEMSQGDRMSIYKANAVIIDGYALNILETPDHTTIQIGDKMMEGPKTWIVTAITKPLKTYTSHPKAYMLSSHLPSIDIRPYFILVKAAPSITVEHLAHEIKQRTGYDALTTAQFTARALQYFRDKTPVIIIFISVAILGFVIGMVVMWQIFSNFTLTHLHQFGMLKMLGVTNSLLIKMVLFQASVVGGAGYFIGLALTVLFGLIFHDTNIAFHLTPEIALLGALGTTFMVAFSSYLSILKVLRLDTVDLCRDLN